MAEAVSMAPPPVGRGLFDCLTVEDLDALQAMFLKIMDEKFGSKTESISEVISVEIKDEMTAGIKGEVEEILKVNLDGFKQDQEVVTTTFRTEFVELKKITKSLSENGDMVSFVKKQEFENLNLTNGSFENIMDMSSGEIVSNSYLVEGGNQGAKPKNQAPGELKNSIWNCVGCPASTSNWLYFREDTFSSLEIEFCQDWPLIPDRHDYFEGLEFKGNVKIGSNNNVNWSNNKVFGVRVLSIIPDKFQTAEMNLIVFCIRAIPWCCYDLASVKKFSIKLQLLNDSRYKANFK